MILMFLGGLALVGGLVLVILFVALSNKNRRK
jgi:hypothetical protein